MKTNRPLALVCSGPISHTSIIALPNIARVLGPVKSANLRVASRIVNTLGAGVPVETMEEIGNCETVLLNAASDSRVPMLIGELARERFDWQGKTVMLYDSSLDSSALRALKGADAATIGPMPGLRGLYLFEGGARALRVAQRLFEIPADRWIALGAEEKGLYLAARARCAEDLSQTLARAGTAFRAAGLDRNHEGAAVQALLMEAQIASRSRIKPKVRDLGAAATR